MVEACSPRRALHLLRPEVAELVSGANRGAARERKVAKEARADGWIVKGTGDSHGAVDQIHLKKDMAPRCVQVKGSSVSRGRFADFPPEDRELLLQEAAKAGAEAWLAWAPPDRKPTRWIPPIEWPGMKERVDAAIDAFIEEAREKTA